MQMSTMLLVRFSEGCLSQSLSNILITSLLFVTDYKGYYVRGGQGGGGGNRLKGEGGV